MSAAAKRAELVLPDPAPAVAFGGFGPYALSFTVFAWAKPERYLDMLHNLRRAISEDLNAASMQIPLSQVIVQKRA